MSAAELLVGALVVIGHNVYRLLPNEVPILVLLALVSFRCREGSWTAIGLARPAAWSRVVAIALAAAALRIVLGRLVVMPLAERRWPPIAVPSGSQAITGDLRTALLWLLIVWTFAAFGEEIAYRGYLLNRAADLGRRSGPACWFAAVVSSALFGCGHFYKGPAGMVDSAVAGLILAGAYLFSGRSLWASILAHGFIDTFAVAAEFLGWGT